MDFVARVAGLLVLAGFTGVIAAPGAGAGTALDRGWTAERIDPGESIIEIALAAIAPGTSGAVYNVSRSPDRPEMRARVSDLAAGETLIQTLDSESFFPSVDGSIAGGAVAAWYREDVQEVRIAELHPGERRFGSPHSATASGGNFSYGRPIVRVNERGDSIVVYLSGAGELLHWVVARYRPAGGRFGPPERVAGPAAADRIYPRDAALGVDGTAIVSLVQDGRAGIATRPPDGTFGAAEPIGEPLPEHSWRSPQVGIDASGNVVAAWLEGAPVNDTGPVKLAFRRAGATFGSPVDTGLRATDHGRIGLGVSRIGEVVLTVEASTTNPYGGTHIEGIHAVTGNSLTGRIRTSRALTGIWGSYPSFAMNARGDAVIVWDECCPMALRARRRAPHVGFGPVVEVQPPIEVTQPRGGRWALDADLDLFGNAQAAWVDSEPEPREYFLGADGPLIDVEPPEPDPLGDSIPPVLDEVVPRAGPPKLSGVPAPPPSPTLARRLRGDGVPPRVRLRVLRVSKGLRPRVGVVGRCSERCRLRVSGTVAGVSVKPVDVVLRARRPRRVILKVPRRHGARAARAVRRSRGAVPLRLRAVAVDAARNVGRTSLRALVP